MASQTKRDELNTLSIEKYFGEMELSDEEKELRIDLAEELELIFLYVFMLADVMSALDDTIDEGLLLESLVDRYMAVVDEFYPDIPKSVRDEVSQYVSDISNEIVKTTVKNVPNKDGTKPYGTNAQRALQCAENEANTVGNAMQYKKAISDGMTKKTWVTLGDEKVRHTHYLTDGETIGIYDEFEVGTEKMLYPRQLGKSAREVIGCRCSLKYS